LKVNRRARGVPPPHLSARRRGPPTPEFHCVRAQAGVKLTSQFLSGAFFMQIEERMVGDVVVLDLKGKITLGEGDELLKDKVNSLVNQGHKKIVLNLADVPYIDSAGLGEVVRTYTTVSRQGGSLKLLNLTKRITDLLSITKLLTVFETFDSENEAVRSFSASAKV
jgi:anti-sigma B factor antagonist